MKSEDKIVYLELDDVDVNNYQPRKIFDEESLLELRESIRKNGLIQPIVVRRFGDRYQLVSGERRLRAAKSLGLGVIASIIRDLSDRSSLEVAIIENIQRKDLTIIEEAESYKKLIDDFNYTHAEVADVVCKSRSHVTNHLRILLLPNKIKELLGENKLSLGHAKLLINVGNNELIAEKIIRLSLNVRQTENLIRSLNKEEEHEENEKNKELCKLEDTISKRLGMRVVITDSNNENGNVRIFFRTLGELKDILERLS